MKIKSLLASSCFVLGFLVATPIASARDPWALSGNEKNGRCEFNAGGDQCEIGQYPTRDRGKARGIGGFYIDPLNYTPPDRSISIRYEIRYCNNNNWTGTFSHILSNRGSNWIDFGENVCEFRYGLYRAWGEALKLEFEMNYYLDY